jgi:RNA polymerase sigma-70 factor (ECF subfamily)
MLLLSPMSNLPFTPSDAELIQGIRNGEQDPLRILYDRYGGLVYTVALRILQRTDEAEDITQEVFLTFWKNGKYDPKRAALSTYLGLLARSRALTQLEQRSRHRRSLNRLQQLEPWDVTSPSPLELASLEEQHQQVREALKQLSENQRQVLTLSYYQGLSYSEISQRLNLPLGTVKTNARQGLLKLRKILGNAID